MRVSRHTGPLPSFVTFSSEVVKAARRLCVSDASRSSRSSRRARSCLKRRRILPRASIPAGRKNRKRQPPAQRSPSSHGGRATLITQNSQSRRKRCACPVYRRDPEKSIGKMSLDEITEDFCRDLFDKIVDKGAPAVAVYARVIVLRVFSRARMRGVKLENPAAEIPPTSIAHFCPRERNMTPAEIGVMLGAFR